MAEENVVIDCQSVDTWKEHFDKGKDSKKLQLYEENVVIDCQSVDTWKEHFDKGKDSKKLVVVDFTASWCGPCRFIAPILSDLAKKTPNVMFLKVDVDELKSVAQEWKVEAMPTFVFLKDGQEVYRVVGAKKDSLVLKVAELASEPATASA